jgi:DNA-binding transcriptional LysR family regulator
MDLDLRRLRYFVTVAELLHFRRASEQLRIAQPALSRQIRALEAELGVKLFRRDTRTVELTPAGRQLREDAVGLLAAAQAAQRRAIRVARGTDAIVVGFMPGIVVTPAVSAFGARYPELRFEVVRITWEDQATAILDGRVDLGYLRRPFDSAGLRTTLLRTEPYRVAVPRSHALARRRSVKEADLAGMTRIHHATHPVRSVEEKLELVAAGKGVCVLPEGVARYYKRPDVTYVLVGDMAPNEVHLAYSADRRSAILAELVTIAQAATRTPARRRDSATALHAAH